jgi:hypothetical protein
VAGALADAERGAREAPRPEGALVQPLDGERVVGRLRQDGDREIVHGSSSRPITPRAGKVHAKDAGCSLPPPMTT